MLTILSESWVNDANLQSIGNKFFETEELFTDCSPLANTIVTESSRNAPAVLVLSLFCDLKNHNKDRAAITYFTKKAVC